MVQGRRPLLLRMLIISAGITVDSIVSFRLTNFMVTRCGLRYGPSRAFRRSMPYTAIRVEIALSALRYVDVVFGSYRKRRDHTYELNALTYQLYTRVLYTIVADVNIRKISNRFRVKSAVAPRDCSNEHKCGANEG